MSKMKRKKSEKKPVFVSFAFAITSFIVRVPTKSAINCQRFLTPPGYFTTPCANKDNSF